MVKFKGVVINEKRLFLFTITDYVEEDIFLGKFRELILNDTKFEFEKKGDYQILSFDVYLMDRRGENEIKREVKK